MSKLINQEEEGEGMRVYHLTYSPEVRTACLHFHGCNFRCSFCVRRGNPYDVHLRRPPSAPLRFLGLEEVLTLLERAGASRVILLGGEPTLDPELPALLGELRERGMAVRLLTNGYALGEEVLEGVDEICVSLKAYTPSLHRRVTGRDNRRVLENLRRILSRSLPLGVESVYVPGLVEGEEVERIARFLSSLDPGIPYHLDALLPPDGRWRAPSPEEVEEAAGRAGRYLRRVTFLTGREEPRYETVSLFP
jgi:pyruvate-formate lyase-activating enzyme